MKKVIIVDDHEIFLKGLKLQVEEIDDVSVVASASSGEEFLQIIETTECDMVFMDIKMPGINGIETTKLALERNPNLRIVALSMFGDSEYLQSILDAGARGFLLKNVNKDELEKAIKNVCEGNNYFSDEMLKLLTSQFVNKSSTSETVEVANLTNRELEVLQFICKGYTNVEIARKLFLSQRTIDGHRAKIISKTDTKNTVSLVIYAVKHKLFEL